jgi:D-alanyl-lipoteichoic acid acyltransferase DltB (MBOAT superfamily)
MDLRRLLAYDFFARSETAQTPPILVARRGWILFVLSIAAVFLMPQTQRGLALATLTSAASIVVCMLMWTSLRPETIDDDAARRSLTIVFLLGLAAVVARTAMRYDTSLPDMLRSAAPAVAVLATGVVVCATIVRFPLRRRAFAAAGIVLLVGLLFILKWRPAEDWAVGGLQRLGLRISGDDMTLPWLGISYMTFRIIGSLIESRSGRLPAMSLYEFVVYVLFPPTLVAGPIDRAENFLRDLRTPFRSDGPPFGLGLATADVVDAGRRIAFGALKAFVIAEMLTTIMLKSKFADILPTGMSSWLPLYAFTLHLYFDFAGYSDIAIGLARLLGIRAPENFRRPFLAPNLTEFWSRWHMSLTQWIRAYWFNPFVRALRRRSFDGAAAILAAQISTMLLIGLWHGVSVNFALWGLWHGCGLFLHNRWSEFARRRLPIPEDRPRLQAAAHAVGAFVTFHFFALSLVFFAVETPQAAAALFARLFWIA